MTYQRFNDWPARLDAFIEQHRSTPFTWGTHDCCQTARRAVQAITGKDPGRGMGLRRYSTAKGGLALLESLGGVEALSARAGLQEVPVAKARRGDLLLVEHEGRQALTVCVGADCAVPIAGGLTFLPTLRARRAWRVG